MPNEKPATGPVMVYPAAPVTHKNFISLPVVPPPVAAVHAAIPPVAVHPNRISAPVNTAAEQATKNLFKIYP